MSVFDALDARYQVILCDIWGVVHDGVSLYAGAQERLQAWQGEGRCVVLITNAPRTADEVDAQLARLGLARDAYDFVETGGEAGIEGLRDLDEAVGFIGTKGDRAVLEGRGVRIANGAGFTNLACTGLGEDKPTAAEYTEQLEHCAARGVTMHCLNPDRVVVRGGIPEPCAGALADIYEAFGGKVVWYGKPHSAIYERALRRAGHPDVRNVLAIGDGLLTDMLGAARRGMDAVFVSGGIHAGEEFPENFAADNDLGDWRPVAVVDSLA
jgi:HAD superfamily hydrolase (TIGR01459 family)